MSYATLCTAEGTITAYLVQIGASTRYTSLDVAVKTTAGQAPGAASWTPAGLTVNGVSSSQGEPIGGATVEFGADDAMLLDFFGGDFTDTAIKVYVAWFASPLTSLVPDDVYTAIDGVVAEASIDATGTQARISLVVSPFIDLNGIPLPRRRVTPKCTYAFKGPACAYAGAATECDRTLTTCTALSNQTRFGGFGAWTEETR